MDEIRRAQDQLGRAIQRAQGEGGSLAELVRELGLRFVQQFTGLLRLARMHALDNEAFNKPVADFASLIAELAGVLGAIHVVAVEDQVYVNDVRMRLPHEEGGTLSQLLKRHNVGGISFHSRLDEPQIRGMVACFSEAPARGRRRGGLRRSLKEAGVYGIDLTGVFLFQLNEEDDVQPSTVRMMERAHRVVEDAWSAVGDLRVPNPLPLRRSVTEMLSSGLEAEGLWDRFDDAEPHSRHSVRVARYALLIGEAIGLNPSVMQDLGVAAVFHDIGYVAREGAIQERPGRAAHPGYPPPFERHGAAGARLLLKQRGFHEARVHRMLATLEHHRDTTDPAGRPSLFARIIRIAEDFDNFSASRRAHFSPARALELMVPLSGTAYDPVLFQLFMNRLGKYPPGTLLKLTDGRIVCSRSLVRIPEAFDRPECFLVREADGTPSKVSGLIDLVWDGVVDTPVDLEFRPYAALGAAVEDEPTQAFSMADGPLFDDEPSLVIQPQAPIEDEPVDDEPTDAVPFQLDMEDEEDDEDDDSDVIDSDNESEWSVVREAIGDPEAEPEPNDWDDDTDWG